MSWTLSGEYIQPCLCFPSAKAGCLMACYSLALYAAFGSVLLPPPFAVVPFLPLLSPHPSSLLHFLIQWEMLPPALL